MKHVNLIDSHCHLDFDYKPKSTENLVLEASQAGVIALVTIGTTIDSIHQVQKISDRFTHVYHTVGVHPHEASTIKDSDISILEAASHHPKCKAIGEIGLDYYYEHSPQEVQQLHLERQLDLAIKTQLPVVIHSREGEQDLLHHLKNYSLKIQNNRIPGIIHCFSGTLDFGKKCLDLGFYISFSGILTFKKAEEVREAARVFPLDRIIVETDAPYLAPMPFRGKKCEPSMVKLTAEKLAEVKMISFFEVAEKTTENSKKIFNII